MRLHILDEISLPGRTSRPNEDAFGHTAECAFVIDGATGLGPNLLVANHDSDAAWLAAFARVHFEEMVRPGRPLADIVRHVNRLAARIVEYAAAGETIPAWQLPIAAFSMVRIETGATVVHGLGDCSVTAVGMNGKTFAHTPMPGNRAYEMRKAREAIAAAGGLSAIASLADHAETREALRQSRAEYNRSGAAWLLGTAAEAGDHLATASLGLEPPFTGLLMTDGFAALAEAYGRYGSAELVRLAEGNGLAHLGDKLRHIETVEDPDGIAHPRFKVSDDATAILFRVE